MKSIKELGTYAENTWCPGCGNFGILTAVKKALVEAFEGGLKAENVVMVSGIGCHAKIVDYVNVNSFYSLHGRVLPPATGISLSNPELTVICHAGDGDAYGEGIAHLIFTAKRNVDITLIVHDNRVYGLTTGQFTPTSPEGFKGRSTPKGSPERPINPLELVLSAGATFVARGYSGKIGHLKNLILEGVSHRGFSFIEVLQPCYTFFNTYSFYNERVYELEEGEGGTSDRNLAVNLARKWSYDSVDASIPIGIFYKEQRPTFQERILGDRPLLKRKGQDVFEFIKEAV